MFESVYAEDDLEDSALGTFIFVPGSFQLSLSLS
jgi:hypothetical protein